MKTRSLKEELLDDPRTPPERVRESLGFMAGVNRFFGGTRVVLDYFEETCREESFTVLDLGTGSGDIPQALARWARRRGRRADVTALDTNPVCIEYARKHFPSTDVRYLETSAFQLDQLQRFDYIISSMFFHHLPDERIVELLKMMRRNCHKGFIINDLYRSILPYAGATILGVLSMKPIIFNDGRLSVARAFRRGDLERYRRMTGFPELKIERKSIGRITLSYHVDRR